MMMQYGNVLIDIEAEDTDSKEVVIQLTVCEAVIFELWRDQIQFINPIYQAVLDEFQHQLEQGNIPTLKTFIHHPNPAISQVAINVVTDDEKAIISPKWEKLGVNVPKEIHALKKGVQHQLFSLKEKRLSGMITQARDMLKTADPFENEDVFKFLISLENQKKRVNKILGRTVIR